MEVYTYEDLKKRASKYYSLNDWSATHADSFTYAYRRRLHHKIAKELGWKNEEEQIRRINEDIFKLITNYENLKTQVNHQLPVESCYCIDENTYLGKMYDRELFLLFYRIDGRFQVVDIALYQVL